MVVGSDRKGSVMIDPAVSDAEYARRHERPPEPLREPRPTRNPWLIAGLMALPIWAILAAMLTIDARLCEDWLFGSCAAEERQARVWVVVLAVPLPVLFVMAAVRSSRRRR